MYYVEAFFFFFFFRGAGTRFQTEPPSFAPTFKTMRGKKEGYSAKRIPSYTDRILWKSLPGHAPNLELLEFVSFPEVRYDGERGGGCRCL